jgi:hypothetical protein
MSISDIGEKNKYGNAGCCNDNSNIDVILRKFESEKNALLDMYFTNLPDLVSSLWKNGSILSKDNSCMCNMKNEKSHFICPQCKNIGRMVNLNNSASGVPFLIQCGKNSGSNFIVYEIPLNDNLYLQYDLKAKERTNLILERNRSLIECSCIKNRDITYIKGDKFTVGIINSWLVERTMKRAGIPHFSKMYTSFVCNNIGFSLNDNQSIDSIDKMKRNNKFIEAKILRSDITNGIITQLLSTLISLEDIQFTHGNPDIRALIFDDKPCSYLLNGLSISSPFTLKITNFSHSSTTVDGTRLYSHGKMADKFIEKAVFKPAVETSTTFLSDKDDNYNVKKSILTYKVGSESSLIFSYIRHSGVPLFSSSFDFYCFMIALMAKPIFYNSIMNDLRLYKLWTMMWQTNQLGEIENRLSMLKDSAPNNIVICSILHDLNLRCDITHFMFDLLKKGW